MCIFYTGMSRDDLFNTNASIVRDLVKSCTMYIIGTFGDVAFDR